MPPKDKKKGGGGAEDMTIPLVNDREPLPNPCPPKNVKYILDYDSGAPRQLLPKWSDEDILTEDWGDPDSEEKFVDADFALPENIPDPVQWLRPTEFIKQPIPPPQPEMTEEEKAAAEKAKAEADKKKGKGKAKGKGKGKEESSNDDPWKIFPDVVITEHEEAWKELCKDLAAKAKAEEEGASAPQHDRKVPRVFSKGFVRVWSEQQKEDIAKDKAMREDLAIQRQKREEERQALLAEAQELGEDPASWLGDFEETEGVKDLSDPPELEFTPEGEEVEAAFASLLRVVFKHADNVLSEDPFLWECIYPQENGRPIVNPAGKYALKVFQAGEWRKLVIDDRIPCDGNSDPLLVRSTNPGELWPTLIAKGIYKLYAEQARDTACFTNTVGINSASIAAFTLHTLCSWLPELLPILEGDEGWNLLLKELPHQKEEDHEDHEEHPESAEGAPAEGQAEADPVVTEAEVESTEEEKAAKEAAEAAAKAKAEAEAKEAARLAALRTQIPLLVTTKPYTKGGDVKTWTNVTSEGEASKIEEINAEGQVHVLPQTGKPMWVLYEEMESEGMQVLLLHTRYQATYRATMDCHWQVAGEEVEEEPVDPKAKKGKGKKDELAAEELDAEPKPPAEVVYRPPASDSILCLQVDDSNPEADTAADQMEGTKEDTNVVVCLAVDGMAEPLAGEQNAVIRLEEELPPYAPEQQENADQNDSKDVSPPLLTFQMSTSTLQSATFTVPAGSSKLFQVDVQAPQGYTVTFSSSAKLTVLDIAAGRTEQFGVRVVEAEGQYPAAQAGQWNIWTRQVFKLPGAGAGDGADTGDADSEEAKPIKTMAWLQLADKDISPYVTLYTIDNDTAQVTKHPSLSTVWMPCYPNTNGYTVLAAARCKSRDLPAGKWRLCVAGEGEGMADLARQPSSTINTFSAPYVPNKYFTLFRDVLCTTTDPTSLALRLTCSDASARLRLRVFENPPPVDFDLDAADEETGENVPPVTPEKKLLAETRARGCAVLLGINALEHEIPEVDAKATEMPAQYIVEASLDQERWDIPHKYHSVLPFYRREAAAATQPEDEETEELPPHIDLPEDSDVTWSLQVVSADELVLRPDVEKETVECMRRQMWEAKEPGRQVQAKISRLRHLGEVDKAAALEEALAEAASGGKDKKGKGKDGDGEAETAAAAKKFQRRVELQAVQREPAIRQCPAAGAQILTVEARAQQDKLRIGLLKISEEEYATLITAREEAATAREEELTTEMALFCAERKADNDAREKIFSRREDWRLTQQPAAVEPIDEAK